MRHFRSAVEAQPAGAVSAPLFSGVTLNLEFTLRDLPCHDASLPLSATGHDIDDLLRENHDLPGIIVAEGGAIVAVIARQRWLEELSQPFRAELYLNHPVERAVLALAGDWLVLHGATPVHEAADQALARGRDALFDPIVVEIEPGRYRLLDAHVLFMAQSRLFAMSRERSESLRGDVEAYARELEQTLVNLRETQDDLVEARRMAAMARMLAGMAHEINTPVGIVLTAVTHLQENLAALAAAFADGQLRRSTMERFLAGAGESVGLARANVERAVDLVRSFKRVAVDETSEARRQFELASYLDQVILSLRPLLKHLPHKVSVDCPAGITLDSYPGALAQILSNLMVNAVEHAFPDGRQGNIGITCRQEGDMLTLRFGDDGCGIPEADQAHLFEPFFTTRGHAGGSGLGLHIVFNLVTKVLHGTISCSSRTGQGTTFTMRFPLVVA
jgi:signal transduction histidine kinase